jgi:ATP-dependent DNA helicase RecG
MAQQKLPLFISELPEDNNIEFKSGSDGRLPKDVWKTISAFSNTDGGKIILGLTREGNDLKLTKDSIDKLQQDIVSLCQEGFSSIVTPEVENTNGVLIVHIPPVPAQLRPLYSKKHGRDKGAYVRMGSSNIMASDEMLKRFSVAAKGGAETVVYDGFLYTEYFNEDIISEFKVRINKSKGHIYQQFTDKEILIKQKAINAEGYVTLFGLLAFGKDLSLQEVVAPTINIAVTQYSGLNKVNEDNLLDTFLDNREFDGNAIVQFERAFSFIKSKLPIRGTVELSGIRKDYLVIPEIALREALANAIAHRDYASHASRVQVDIYSDRIEIINPGTSLVPIEQLENAPSASRNPLLMTYLKEFGITEQKARGIRTIKISLKQAGLLEPTFENIHDSFKITLSRSAFISSEDKTWLVKFAPFKLNERQQSALAHVRNNPAGITNSEYREINSMTNVRDDKKANKELRRLVELGLLSPLGANRARRYVINPQFLVS